MTDKYPPGHPKFYRCGHPRDEVNSYGQPGKQVCATCRKENSLTEYYGKKVIERGACPEVWEGVDNLGDAPVHDYHKCRKHLGHWYECQCKCGAEHLT